MSDTVTREARPESPRGREPARPEPARRGDARPDAARLVFDDDRGRARETEALLHSLADRLGFRVDDIRVHADEEAARETRPRGARGVMRGGAIWLDPNGYDPRRADGRALLAHEAAHVAQRAETRQRADRAAPSVPEAEREAAAIASAVREGRAAPRPTATLPEGAVAADTGAAVEAATPTTPEPAPAPPRDPLADYRAWRSELGALAAGAGRLYPRQLATLHDKLDGLWVSDGDVDRVMEVLEPLPADDAAALVRALGHDHRVRLVDNVSDSHRRNFRREVLASYAALLTDELARFDQHLFDALSPEALTPQEHFLAVVALLGLPGEARRVLQTGDSRRAIGFHALMSGRAPDTAEALRALRARQARISQRLAATARLANDPAYTSRLDALQRRLRDPSRNDALIALDELRAVRPGTQAAPVSERAASEALPPQPPAPEPDAFAILAERLEQTGAIERLLRKLPERDQLTPERRDTFLALLRHRPVDANVRLAVSLLDTGFFTFHWWVSQAEATLAWEVVRALPLDARDRFLRRDDGEWLQRLEASLPAGVRDDPAFAGLAVRRDEHGALVDAGALQAAQLRGGGSQLVTSILQTLDGSGGGEAATRALDQLLAIREPAMREAVIARLDTLRRLEPMLEHLPETVLYSEDRRAGLTAIAGARDPAHLLAHIHRLISTNLLDWAVTSHEAFIAFLMIRALPQGDRDRLGQLEFIVGEMSPSMRASAGLNMLDARSASAQLDAVRTRLRDERLWTAEHAPELRSLVGIAAALGDREWVFEQSRVRRAWDIEALRPMVARFGLYDERPPTPRTRFSPERVEALSFGQDIGFFNVLRMIGSFVAIVVRDGFAGRIYVNLARGELGTNRFRLNDAQDLLGGDQSGARLRDRYAPSDASERAHQGGGTETIASNEATIRWNWANKTLDLDLPRLELDSIGRVGGAWSFHTGRVTARGIHAHADFESEEASRPARADLRVADVEMDDVVAGTTTELKAAARLHLAGLGIDEAADLEPPGPPSSTYLPVPVFGAVVEVAGSLLRQGLFDTARGGPREIAFQLSNFEVEGLSLGAEQQIASLSVAGIRVTWAGTRARYLRALIDTLDRRITAAVDSTEQARLRTQQDDARRELRDLEPREERLRTLVARARDPHATPLSAAEQAELIQLQESGRGGVIVDTGAVTLRGLSGAVSVREVQVDRIRGQGSSDAFTAGLFTDDAILRRFAQQGPGLGSRQLSGEAEFELGTITATDIAIEREIPATRTLRDEREALARDRHGLVAAHQDELLRRADARYDRLGELIRDREQLDELEALESPTPEQVRRRRDLHTALARTFGVTVASAELRGVTLRATGSADLAAPGGVSLSGAPTLSAASLDVRDVRSDAYAVRRVTGEDLSLGVQGVIPGLGGSVRPEPSVTGASVHAGHLRMEGVRADQLGSTVESIDLRGLDGAVEQVPNGWRITGMRLATLAVSGVDWGTTTQRIRATRTVTVSDVRANLTIITSGEERIEIGRIDIGAIEVGGAAPGGEETTQEPTGEAGLIYENFESGIRARIFSGALRGLWAEGLTLRMGATTRVERTPASATSGAGVRQFDAVRFAGALGESFSGGGTLSSPQGAARDAFGVRLLDDGRTQIDLVSLLLTQASVTTPSGTIRIERVDLSGTARIRTTADGREIEVEGFHISHLVLGNVDWRMTDGAVITARRHTELHELRAALTLRTNAAGVAGVTIQSLHIDRITGEDLRYQKGDIDVRVNIPSAPGHPPLEIVDVNVAGVQWDPRAGLTAGTVTVGSAAAGIDARFASDITARGHLRAETISLRFAPGERITARAESVDADAEFVAGTTTGALSFSGLDTGGIEISPTQIRIGAGSQPHMRFGPLGRLNLGRLHFANDQVTVDVDASGRGLNLTGLDAAITLDLNPAGTTPRLRRVTIDELNLDMLRGSNFRIGFGPSSGTGEVEFRHTGSDARLEGARVHNLAFENSSSGWVFGGYADMHLDMLALEEVGVRLNLATLLAPDPSAPPSPAFSPSDLLPYRRVLNSLDGQLDFDLTLPMYYLRNGSRFIRLDDVQPAFWVRVAFDHGQVNISQVEHTALGAVADEMIDIEHRGNRLVLELDPRRALTAAGAAGGAAAGGRLAGPWGAAGGAVLGGGAGLAGGYALRRDLVYWNLESGETETSVSAFTLSQYNIVSSGPGPSPIEFDVPNLHAHVLETTRLNLVNEAAERVPLGTRGSITLAPQALHGLTLSGDIPGPLPFNLGLDALAIESVDLNLGGFGHLTSGLLLLQGVTDGRLTFTGLSPAQFTGQITHFHWGDLNFTGHPLLPLSTPAAPPRTGGTP